MQVIQVPYDSGHKDRRMGKGPACLLAEGLSPLDLGEGQVETAEVSDSFSLEVGTTFKVLRSLSQKVTQAINHDLFPLVLSGGCISSVGTLAGLGREPVGVVWLDAHGDFNTPETSVSGFLDGMPLAIATGRCWTSLSATIPQFTPLPENHVILIGARDFDPRERSLLRDSEVRLVETEAMRAHGVTGALSESLDRLQADRVYLHVDLDVLDITEARVNQYSSTGGITVGELLEIVNLVASKRIIAAAAITAYDPEIDEDRRALRAATALAKRLHTLVQSRLERAS